MFPDSSLIAADCGRQPRADQALLDLLLALLGPDDEKVPGAGQLANLSGGLCAR